MDRGKSKYSQASMNKMLELLSQFHGVDIGRSWGFQCLKDLEDEGYLKRTRRYWRLDGGLIRSRPSLWYFTVKGMKWLVSKAAEGSREFLNKMLLWLKKIDGRFPAEPDFFVPFDNQKALIDIQRFERMAEGVTKDII
jgi:hypothetical protein